MAKSTNVIEAIPNTHVEECGEPPAIDPDKVKYLSYFQSEHGDQFAFVVRPDGTAELWAGDAGWTPRPVEDGPDGRPVGHGLVLVTAEELWLGACWLASSDARRGSF